MVSIQFVIILSVFVFFAGVIGGLLFCRHYGHKELSQASTGMNDAEFDSKAKTLEEETKRNPGNAASWTQLGNFYFDGGQYERAIEAYQKSLSLDPNNADVWTDMGIMYRSTDRPHKAIEAFERAMAIDPKHQNSRFNKGVVLMYDLNQEESAVKEWEELGRINPSYELSEGEHLDELILHYKLKQEENKVSADQQPGKEGVTVGKSQSPL